MINARFQAMKQRAFYPGHVMNLSDIIGRAWTYSYFTRILKINSRDQMQEVPDLIACEECDAIHSRPTPGGNEVALCSRCGAELERDMSAYSRRALPLAIASFFIYIIANTFPIVEMELQGIVSRTTLIGSVLSLNAAGMPFVASLVLATTILFPLIQLLVLIYLLLSAARSGYHPAFNLLARLLQTLQPWVMVEVFLLEIGRAHV